MFSQEPHHIIYCYSESTSNITEDCPEIELHKGLPTSEQLSSWIALHSQSPWMLILDDLNRNLHESPISEDLSCKLSHHHNATVCVIGHSVYGSGGKSGRGRLISLNTHYFFFTSSLRDRGVFATFGRQILGSGRGGIFEKAFLDATTKQKDDGKPGYLFVTLHPLYASRDCMLFGRIMPDEAPTIAYKTT